MINKKDLGLAIDSSLSYCSITVFKNKKIIWNKEKKCDFGHEKHLSLLLSKMVEELNITSKNFSSLYLNYGPARFTCLRNCHALMKGFFINRPVRVFAYSIFEHYFLGLKSNNFEKLACILDTNRRDLGLQIMNNKGELMGDFQTCQINEQLIEELDINDLIIGNGINRIRDIRGFSEIKYKCKNPIQLKSKYFMNDLFKKRPLRNIPKITYPYSPI